jgi:hypothetical protein
LCYAFLRMLVLFQLYWGKEFLMDKVEIEITKLEKIETTNFINF